VKILEIKRNLMYVKEKNADKEIKWWFRGGLLRNVYLQVPRLFLPITMYLEPHREVYDKAFLFRQLSKH
jgi:hypothetical protein